MQINNIKQMQLNTLKLLNLECVRGERLLFRDLNFQAQNKQLVHITGANGTGKTSLLRLVCGFGEAEQGEIQWNNRHIKDNNHYASSIAYIGHKDGLKNELTAYENLKFYQQLDHKPDDDVIDRHLNTMGILHCADLAVWKLSFGQRRRLAFARLLIRQFPLWILDEPFTGIDTKGRALIEDLSLFHLVNGGIILLTHHGKLENSKLTSHVRELNLDSSNNVNHSNDLNSLNNLAINSESSDE